MATLPRLVCSACTGAALLLFVGCEKKQPPAESVAAWSAFNPETAFEELENITSFGSRAHGTPGHSHIGGYLRSRLKAIGYDAEIHSFTNQTHLGEKVFRNIEARIPGTSRKFVIVSTHYDSMQNAPEDFQAANAAGSGPAVLLEIARVAKESYQGSVGIRFIFFDGQEPLAQHIPGDGLRGSSHYAEKLEKDGRIKDVLAMINLDLVGDKDLTITIPKNVSNNLRLMLLNASHRENARNHFELFPAEIGDDHEPFYRRFVPAINIIDFEYGSEPGRNDYWRTEKDTLDKTSAESLDITGRVTLRLLQDLIAEHSAGNKIQP